MGSSVGAMEATDNATIGTKDDKMEEGKVASVERGHWSNPLDFLFSCISVSVGLGNVWRFPYLCYKNGGGSFLIVYFISMALCGIPIFVLEVAVGQYLGEGGMTLVGKLCPLLGGTGPATMVLVCLLNVYYCVIVGWAIFYLIDDNDFVVEVTLGHYIIDEPQHNGQ